MSTEEIKTERRGGYRENAGRPKGARNRRPQTDREKDAKALREIENLLESASKGEIALDASRLKAIELRYSRLRPTLSSVDQTIHDERDTADASALAARLAALFHEKPALFDQVMALRSAANAHQQTDKKDEQRVTH